jgi:hypothetical protein
MSVDVFFLRIVHQDRAFFVPKRSLQTTDGRQTYREPTVADRSAGDDRENPSGEAGRTKPRLESSSDFLRHAKNHPGGAKEHLETKNTAHQNCI